MEQRYTSACTSINESRLPSIFKKVRRIPNRKNLDYGGGKYDNATEWLAKEKKVANYIYDPYNRSNEWNNNSLANGPFDTATLSNVLNVVMEREVRINILKHIKSQLKPNGNLYIKVYEGNRSRNLSINKNRNSCQLNKPLIDYLEEVKKVFENYEIKYNMIKAW